LKIDVTREGLPGVRTCVAGSREARCRCTPGPADWHPRRRGRRPSAPAGTPRRLRYRSGVPQCA